MIVMLFEYWLKDEHIDEYTEHAGILRQLVTDVDGFISIERFRSEADPAKILAVGYFRDENAVREWRNLPEHRQAQALGRHVFFSDYRLCMAQVIRDYAMNRREQVPYDSRNFHKNHVDQ